MSRTYRRKNYELTQNSSWDTKFRKVNGFYTEVEVQFVKLGDHHYTHFYTGKVPNKRELYELKRAAHGENTYARSACSWFRKLQHHKLRGFTRLELHRFMKQPDEFYPMIDSKKYLKVYWD